jgi:hypothetical protein
MADDWQKARKNYRTGGLEIFFSFFLLPPIAITAGAAKPAAPCPHKAGTAPRLGAEGKATTWASRNWVAGASSWDAGWEC